MKRLFALLLVFVMLLSLAACGGDKTNAGVYNAISCEAMGLSLDCEGDWLELKGNGKGKLCLMGEEYNCSWALEGEAFTLKNHGEVFSGTLHNGIITLDFGDMVYVYLMDPVKQKDGTFKGHVHAWKDADCENSKTCTDCGATEGEPLGHDATEANYQDDSVCKNCGAILGEKHQAAMEKYGITEFMEVGVVYPYTTFTNRNESLATTGELIIDSYEIVESAEGFPAKEGYEWRIIKGSAYFFDYNARKNGWWLHYCYEDYYDIDLYDDFYEYDEETEITTRMISYHGEEMPCYLKEIWDLTSWHYDKDKGRKESYGTFTRAWQVPIGYDGIVAGFFNDHAIDWEDYHLYEIYDPEYFWLFRLN